MKLTNEEYVAKGGGECPFCGSGDISGDFVEIDGNQAMQRVGCGECPAVWEDHYTLSSYKVLEQGTSPDSNIADSLEYSVCEDCLQFIVNDEVPDEDPLGRFRKHMHDAIQRELGDRTGHFNAGVKPTEDDPEGSGYEEFSSCECELCRSKLGGSRHGVTLLFTK